MNEKIQNISELDKQCADKNTLSVIVLRMFNTSKLQLVIKSIGLENPNGRSVYALLQNLMLFRLYKDEKIDWRKLLYAASLCFRHVVEANGDGQSKSPRCIIFDDTMIQKSNSGCVLGTVPVRSVLVK